jgi:hypothetical protein
MKINNFLMSVMVFFITSLSFAQYDMLLTFGNIVTSNEAKLKEMNYKKTSVKTIPENETTSVISTYKNTAGDVVTYINHPYNQNYEFLTNDLSWTGTKLYTAEGIMNFVKSHKSQMEDIVSNANGGPTISWDNDNAGSWDEYGGQGFQKAIKTLKTYTGNKYYIPYIHPNGTKGTRIMSGSYKLDNNYRSFRYIALEINSPKGKMYKLCMELTPSN